MTKKKLYILIFLLTCSLVNAQFKKEIDTKNTELKDLKEQINKLETELSGLSLEEKNNLSILKKIDKQNLLLGKSIKKIELEEKRIEADIVSLENKINALQKKVKNLQKEFGDYLVWLYKQGENSTLKYLFNSKSFNQALIRYRHLKYIQNKSEGMMETLKKNKEGLEQSIVKLEQEIEEKSIILAQKQSERKKLLERRTERNTILSNLKKDKNNVSSEIEEKRKIEIAIKQMVADLIEKERERERKLRTAKLKGEIDDYPEFFNYKNFENFAELKGKLNWPLQNAKLGRNFGENRNDKTKTVTLNYGIDLIAKDKKDVYAVAEGIVSAIEWLPGYGSIVIITHRDNFRTVYGHLRDINVLEGNKVVAGDLIGKVNESLEGNILHFEIWNERNYQNPEEWLVKK